MEFARPSVQYSSERSVEVPAIAANTLLRMGKSYEMDETETEARMDTKAKVLTEEVVIRGVQTENVVHVVKASNNADSDTSSPFGALYQYVAAVPVLLELQHPQVRQSNMPTMKLVMAGMNSSIYKQLLCYHNQRTCDDTLQRASYASNDGHYSIANAGKEGNNDTKPVICGKIVRVILLFKMGYSELFGEILEEFIPNTMEVTTSIESSMTSIIAGVHLSIIISGTSSGAFTIYIWGHWKSDLPCPVAWL
ncbi:hypothetical protein F5050DRAFT_1901976 [Lentinula boryana]|uniref:Uncharacterized protein n=1 Tax=Lentinula boryana TaxID=40481 RepID=A0ABQ8QGJ3_9AGAR|nr:hypothetical protein F5050DRAFT_1901976 [Lentinula boryana]